MPCVPLRRLLPSWLDHAARAAVDHVFPVDSPGVRVPPSSRTFVDRGCPAAAAHPARHSVGVYIVVAAMLGLRGLAMTATFSMNICRSNDPLPAVKIFQFFLFFD